MQKTMKKFAALAAAFAACALFALDMPFSTCGSYFAVSPHEKDDWFEQHEAGVWIRTVSNAGSSGFIARIIPVKDGKELAVSGFGESPELLTLKTGEGDIEVAFADPETILLRSESVGIRLDFSRDARWRFMWEVPSRAGRKAALATLFDNRVKLLADARRGGHRVECPWDGFAASNSVFEAWSEGDGVEIALRECVYDWDGRLPETGFDDAVAAQRASFGRFLKTVPPLPAEFEQARVKAARLMWSSVVEPRGNLRRRAMLMSKNWMTRIWSWDHCFNAMALAGGDMNAAWDQFMCVFDLQAPNGQLPDAMDAYGSVYSFVKPPVHGWALRRMMATGEISAGRLEEAYGKLSKWTDYWFKCRDRDGNGLCEYDHGNDSGWDNSTAFLGTLPVETPELAAYLSIQMEVLAEIAARLGRNGEAKAWREKAAATVARAVEELFDAEGRPAVRKVLSGEKSYPLTMLTRLSLLLGDALPAKARERMLKEVASDTFLTEWGLATESPRSGYYKDDGYWRGPIWAPETMIAIDALKVCGRNDLAREVALRFCRMCAKGGFAENFDAKTGAPLRDKAYTWTASAFLVIGHELGTLPDTKSKK